jgi:Na+-driven multidrug efflux pump
MRSATANQAIYTSLNIHTLPMCIVYYRLVPKLSWSLLSHAIVLVVEGILLAKRKLKFLTYSYLSTTAILLIALKVISTWTPLASLHGVWSALLAFQALRCTQFLLYLLRITHLEKKEVALLYQ